MEDLVFTKEQIQFLKNNLKIDILTMGHTITIDLYLGEEIISESIDHIYF